MNDSVLIPKERNGSRLSCDFFFFFWGGVSWDFLLYPRLKVAFSFACHKIL